MTDDQGAGRLPDLDPAPLGFRPLERADLPLLHRWLGAPLLRAFLRDIFRVERTYG
jgi:hypothetical protein